MLFLREKNKSVFLKNLWLLIRVHCWCQMPLFAFLDRILNYEFTIADIFKIYVVAYEFYSTWWSTSWYRITRTRQLQWNFNISESKRTVFKIKLSMTNIFNYGMLCYFDDILKIWISSGKCWSIGNTPSSVDLYGFQFHYVQFEGWLQLSNHCSQSLGENFTQLPTSWRSWDVINATKTKLFINMPFVVVTKL